VTIIAASSSYKSNPTCKNVAHQNLVSLHSRKTSTRDIEVYYISTSQQQAYIFTKSLSASHHTSILQEIGLQWLP